jgi:polyferredoxin
VRKLRSTLAPWLALAHESTTPLKAAALRDRARRITRLRRVVQVVSLSLVAWTGVLFVVWVRGVEAGRATVERPAGVEAFLPIAALMSLRHLFTTGEIHPVHPAGLVILIGALGTGLLLKKAFCSWVCPIGTLSEALAWPVRRLFGRIPRVPKWLDVPLRGLKYALLGFFAWTILWVMTPGEIAAFLDSPYSRVADIKMLYFFERPSRLALQVLAGLFVLSVLVPYAWCRYLCPYGALLGVASLLSPLKITRDAASCIDCSLCTKACPARLPVEHLRRVRSDECFGCLSCVAACPVPRALRVETPRPFARAVRPVAFAAIVAGLFFGGILLAKVSGDWQTSVGHDEYTQRVKELDGPGYDHLQGRAGAAAETAPATSDPSSD